MENKPQNNNESIINNGLVKTAVIGLAVGAAAEAAIEHGQANKEAAADKFVVSPANMDILANVEKLQSDVNNKFTSQDFNDKGYGGVNFFLRNAGENSTMSVDVVFFEKGKTNNEIIVASQGLKTIKITLDALTAKNKYAMEALLSGVVAKELGK